jgi:hypothetical protein
MKLTGFRPGGQLGDEVELAEELTHHLTGIVALTQLFELRHDAREGLLGLSDGAVRVVLTLPLEALMMFEKLLAEEIRETLAGAASQGARVF